MRLRTIAIMFLTLMWSQAASAAPPPWRVTELAGTVSVTSGGVSHAGRRGATLAPGAVVQTGANGRVVLMGAEVGDALEMQSDRRCATRIGGAAAPADLVIECAAAA